MWKENERVGRSKGRQRMQWIDNIQSWLDQSGKAAKEFVPNWENFHCSVIKVLRDTIGDNDNSGDMVQGKRNWMKCLVSVWKVRYRNVNR